MIRTSRFTLTCVFVFLFGTASAAPQKDVQRLSKSLQPFVDCLAGKTMAYRCDIQIDFEVKDKPQSVTLVLDQSGAETCNFEARHKEYWIKIQRRPDRTALLLPLHKTAYVGEGKVSKTDHLAPGGLIQRMAGQGSMVGVYLPLLTGDTNMLSLMLTSLTNPKYDAETKTWSVKDEYFVRFSDNAKTMTFEYKTVKVRMQISDATVRDESPFVLQDFQVTQIARNDLERQFARGLRRALEILAPSPLLTAAEEETRTAPGGELRWMDGHRVALLSGTPQQIGSAHGKLLKTELHRCVDSVLYTFGTFQTIRTGRWFLHDLQAAYKRLEPHIPADHKTETIAMANAIGFDPHLARIMNVFPELFHCSGFALFGKATKDGKLYHGRVLDYMTTIGLQDAATTFVIAPDGKIPFITVGYAGFIGSVSGMNAEAISLGEMGGHGEGKWDGVPMATLMRRALEECRTLDEVKSLWTNSPRTCEYYYVFADGKTNDAVGVAATPESIEFVKPGQSHRLLGDGIEDTVLLSSGGRLAKLKERVKERYGQFDAENGKWLMSRPVAMSSNLHNVLFIPEDRILHIANADHKHPAAERPYIKLDLNELLKSMQIRQASRAR